MLIGLIWLFSSVFCAIAIIQAIPKAVMTTVEAYRKRNIEPATKGVPSAVCPVDGGTWSPWSEIHADARKIDPVYSYKGTYLVRTQTRRCNDCGFAERRVL